MTGRRRHLPVAAAAVAVFVLGLPAFAAGEGSADAAGDSNRCMFIDGSPGCTDPGGVAVAADLRSLDVTFVEGSSATATDDALSVELTLDTDTGAAGGQSGLVAGDAVWVFFDTDGDPATGNVGRYGAEWLAQYLQGTMSLYKYAPSTQLFNLDRDIPFTAADGPSAGTLRFSVATEWIQVMTRPRAIRATAKSEYTCAGLPSCSDATRRYFDELPDGGPGFPVAIPAVPAPPGPPAPPPAPAPSITPLPRQATVQTTRATVFAQIGLNGFTGPSRHRVEYRRVGAGGAWTSTAEGVTSTDATVSTRLTGLRPGTAYAYRFVAANTLGGVVRSTVGGEARFTTRPTAIGGEMSAFVSGSGAIDRVTISGLRRAVGGPVRVRVRCTPACRPGTFTVRGPRVTLTNLAGFSLGRPAVITATLTRPGALSRVLWIATTGTRDAKGSCTARGVGRTARVQATLPSGRGGALPVIRCRR